jgi:hypothetical protein
MVQRKNLMFTLGETFCLRHLQSPCSPEVPEEKTHSSSGNYPSGKFYADMQVGIEKDEQNFL